LAKPKALVFVESLEMQKFLAYFLKTKFDMEKMPMRINGSIKRVKRQEYVNEFQLHNNVGFDVMLISPKAGGVGLKLDELLNRKRNMSLDVLPCTEDGTEARGLVDGVCGVAIESDPRTNISLEDIDRLEPVSGFENWVHELAKMDGWALRNTPWSGDHGADGIIEKDGMVAILQCKHVQDGGVIGDNYVDQLLEARTKYQLDDAILVGLTNARAITRKAEERASRYGIETVKRDRILSWSRGII
jgi:HJR/Mrr/RecB family endonuclease